MRQNPHFWKELRKERKEQRTTRQYTDSHTDKYNFERCIAINDTAINWDEIPDIITKDQLYRICHISKSTARYLLQSGKIPCYYTGKQTRCYQIKKEDVIAYLENRKIFPESYSAPAGWYKGNYTIKMKAEVPEVVLEYLRTYYTELLADYPDVLTTQAVSKITGYGTTTINNWCNKGYIKSFKKNNINHIPKVYLAEFFCSTRFRTIIRKSSWHIRTLKSFANWKKVYDLRMISNKGGAKL